MKDIIDDINNICEDIRDNDFSVIIKPNDDISIRMIGMCMKGTISSTHTTRIEIAIKKESFYFSELVEL
jgi:hypothetical protein